MRSYVSKGMIVLLAALAGGCGLAGDLDDTENAVFLVIDTIVPSSDPFGDVIAGSGTILDDTVDVTFAAFLKSPDADPLDPQLQDIVVERYEVEFRRTDGGTAVPPGFQRAMNIRVRVTDQGNPSPALTSITNMVVMPSTIKALPPISFLISPGIEPSTGFINIQLDAVITFFGHTLSGDPVTATGAIGINFANFGDTNS